MKTPEEMARNYCEPILSDEYAKAIGREDWIGTKCVWVGEGHEMYKAFLAGYKAAQEHAHAALEEAEARIQELRDQLADADKVMPDTCDHILDMSKMVDVNGWISVKDRLPEVEMDFLVCCEMAINGNLTKHQHVIRFIGDTWDTSLPGSITHWQVLPKLPKE